VNDFDEFAEIALAIFVAITALIWLLTYLEQTLDVEHQPEKDHRSRPQIRSTSVSRSHQQGQE
jgi:hypothetical protein